MEKNKKQRALSGMRPTGKLHLGHLIGVLDNWREMQETFKCFFFVADWHALTTEYNDPSNIKVYSREMVLDWLTAGIDPGKGIIFLQSDIKEHAELYLMLSMIVPIPWLERVPSYKEMKEELTQKDLSTYGFLSYPVLQASDILIYKADVVPVGIDQVPHVELTREIARRFNNLYGTETFVEPQAKLTITPKLLGLDGRKMGKSYNNCIYLSDSREAVNEKVMHIMTDPHRIKRSDCGDPELSTVFSYHKIFSQQEKVKEIGEKCRTAQIGCVECKKELIKNLWGYLEQFQCRRSDISKKWKDVDDIFVEGGKKAREISSETIKEIKEAMKII